MYEVKNKEFLKTFDELCYMHDRLNIFSDFVKLCAISIHNSFALNSKLEQEYLNTINSYQKEEQDLFSKMYAELVMVFENESTNNNRIIDILGPIYEQEKLSTTQLGQFFTPTHISEFCTKSILVDNEISQIIKNKGFLSLTEPTCGAGGLILSFANELRKKNINYQNSLLVYATDIADICTYMTYIQLSLYGIPAIVYCR